MPMIPMYRPGGDTIAELLMRQGDAAARAAERSAMLWGNAVSNIGNIAGNAVSQYQDQRQQEQQRKQREMMFDEALSTYDPTKPEDFYRRAAVAVGPELATQASRAMSAFYAGKDAGPDLKKFEAKAQFIQSMWQRDPEWVKQRWSVLSQSVAPDVAEIFNVQIGPQWEDSYAPMIESFTPQATRAQGAPERIKQNGVFFERDPQTGAWSAAQGLPAEVAKPEGPVTGTFEKFVADNPGVDVLKLRQRWAAAGREPDKPPVPVPPAELDIPSTGVVITTYGAAKRPEVRKQAQERGIPVFESATAATKAGVMAGIYAEAQELKTLMSLDKVKDAIGAASGRWTQLKGKFVDLDPDVQRAIQLMTSLSDTELRKRSGAQINDKEMSRLLRFTTDPNKTVGHNTTALNGLLKSSNRDYHAMSGGVWLSGEPDSEQNDPLGLR